MTDDYTPSKMDNTEKGDHQKDNAEDLTLPDLVLLLAELVSLFLDHVTSRFNSDQFVLSAVVVSVYVYKGIMV